MRNGAGVINKSESPVKSLNGNGNKVESEKDTPGGYTPGEDDNLPFGAENLYDAHVLKQYNKIIKK